MGSLIPFEEVCCPLPSCLLAGVAVFTSALMITFSLKVLRNRYQFRRLLVFLFGYVENFRLFFHLRDFDVFQNLFDALIHLAQRLADGAAIALIAFAPYRDARSNEQRAVN